MVSPLMSITRASENRRNNTRYTPVGMTVISPTESVSPIDARMTPIRKSLFQRRRLTSNKRRGDFFESRDESNEIESLRSANKKKDGHLKLLHDRFTHIQKGLGSIDEERSQLIEKANRLDKEKKVIQKQLELREREILALIKRCASQEEKMRESSKLRSTNRNLQNHLDVMAKKLEVIEQETHDRQNLKKKLQDSELEREQLRDRLASVQREHDVIAETLQECIGNIRQLTEEKQAIEEERQRERKRTEIELEKQQLAHANDSNHLKANIQEHRSRIQQMERILQDNIKSNTDLRREKAVISQGKIEEIQKVTEKYEQQLKELRNEIEETITEKKTGSHFDKQYFEEEVKLMKERLASKDAMMKELETEFSDQMMKLISKQSSLDEAEEEKRDLESKVESSKKLEIEHAALLDFVGILDSNLAELTTANANLELEKDNLLEETDALRKKANMLQKQFSSLQSNQKAKESDFRELLNADKEELRLELQESLRRSKLEIETLRAEVESRNKYISKLEVELQQARKLIIDKEQEIVRISNEMDRIRSKLGADLRKARLEAAQFEAEVFAKSQALASLEGRLEGAKKMREVGDDFEQDAKNGQVYSLEVKSLRQQLKLKEEDSRKICSELETTIQSIRNEAMFLQQKVESLSKEKSILEKEVEESRGLINDRDEQIVEVQQILLKYKKRVHELERELQHTTKELAHRTKAAATIEENKFEEASGNSTEVQEAKVDVSTKKQRNNYKELEERIYILENELSKAEVSRSESAANLEEAYARIKEMEKQLIGGDTRTKSLQNQLQKAASDLVEEESKVFLMENEYDLTERQNHGEETRFKISTLQEKIEEMKKQSCYLDIQIKKSRQESAVKDKMISSLKVDIAEVQEERKEILSNLRIKSTEFENLELLLSNKNKELEKKIDDTNDSLKSREDRILELEKLVLNNEDSMKGLKESLGKANEYIVQLEDQISLHEERNMKSEEEAVSKLPLDDDFLPSSDTSDLKRKIQILLSRNTELTSKLDKSTAILEEERKSWTVKENDNYKEVSIFKAKLLVLQNVLIERERVISMMQNGEEGDKNQNLITDRRQSDAEKVISNLEREIKLKEKKINDLQNQLRNKKEGGIRYAFVESDKRRIEIEEELALAYKEIEELTATANGREQRLKEADERLEKTREEVAKKNQKILSAERRSKNLEDKAHSLDEKFREEHKQFLIVTNELNSMKSEAKEKDRIIYNLNESTQSLKEVAEKASDEITRKNDIVGNLTETTRNLKLDLQKANSSIEAKGDKIKCLEDILKNERESRMKLEEEIKVTRECMSDSQNAKEEFKKELENQKLINDTIEEDLSEARKALEKLSSSSSEHILSLESQIAKMKVDLNDKDNEIKQIRSVELHEAVEMATSLKKEVALLKEAPKGDTEQTSEKDCYTSQIDALKTELQMMSVKNAIEAEQHDQDKDTLTKMKEELESSLEKLNGVLSQRDATIQELKEKLMHTEKEEEEIRKQHYTLQKSETEARDQYTNMKAEYEQAAARERELMNTRLENKDSLHKEELESALSELESTLKKLQESENLLAARNCRLGEMVDRNRDIELELEKEQEERRVIEEKFVNGQNNLNIMTADLRKAQAELRRKESVLESKLKEERNQKEFAEESLRIAKRKYKEAIKTRRNVTELERENGELKDKIRRQEAYLQRKLQKEKNDRARLTPSKGIVVSPSKRALRTPTRRTPYISGKELPKSSTLSRSRLQAPSTSSRGISTGIPSIRKDTSKTSPTTVSCRSGRTAFTRSTQFQTPSKQMSTLSAQDILQSELDDDRSVTSELSSILRSPMANKSPAEKVPDWELLEPREQ